MKNLRPQCEHPAIILNPSLKDLILHYGCYYKDNKKCYSSPKWYDEFPYFMFGKIKCNLTFEELDNYYIIDKDGEHVPMFMAVPCGKCVLCTEKKSKEWVTRAMCESQTSNSVPYFFTLTYNDCCMPWNGVRKGAMQRFLKRFRQNLNRYLGHTKNKIRYFICSEYGTKTKRPHYHGLLWNVPLLQVDHIVELLEKSWSFQVSKAVYDKFPNTKDKYGNPVFKFYDSKADVYRIRFGYVSASPCTEGRVRYCMKYMRKEAFIPKGKNNIFYLSSRRGGLGSAWIEQMLQQYRDNPQLLDVKLTDIWSGVPYTGSLPRYFKDKIAPTPSRLIKKEVRDNFKKWNYWSNKFHSLIGFHYTPNQRVLEHYPSLYYHQSRINVESLRYKYDVSFTYEKIEPYLLTLNTHINKRLKTNEEFDSYTRDVAKIVKYYETLLLKYDYDVQLSIDTPIYKKKHQFFVEEFINSQHEIPIFDKVDLIRRRRAREKSREIF